MVNFTTTKENYMHATDRILVALIESLRKQGLLEAALQGADWSKYALSERAVYAWWWEYQSAQAAQAKHDRAV